MINTKRITRIPLCLMMILILLCGCGATTDEAMTVSQADANVSNPKPTQGWSVILDEPKSDSGITYSVPSAWKVEESEDESRIYYYPKEDKKDGYLCISKMDANGMTVEEYDTIANAYSMNNSIGQGYVGIADGNGYYVRFFREADGINYDTVTYLYISDQTLFSFMFAQQGKLDENMTGFVSQFMEGVRSDDN